MSLEQAVRLRGAPACGECATSGLGVPVPVSNGCQTNRDGLPCGHPDAPDYGGRIPHEQVGIRTGPDSLSTPRRAHHPEVAGSIPPPLYAKAPATRGFSLSWAARQPRSGRRWQRRWEREAGSRATSERSGWHIPAAYRQGIALSRIRSQRTGSLAYTQQPITGHQPP
jgi:hypothetical protein